MPEDEATIEPRGQTGSSDGDEYSADTISVDSSITQYRIENGRTYHAYKDGLYWAPNDDRQNENLDISHHKFLKLLDGKLLLAPIEKSIEQVLDIGTGTGIWAIDFADEYPAATVIGTDLSPIQPKSVPPNCRFEIDDARDKWLYPVDHFDLIHIRSLFGSIDDWPSLYEQAYKHLKPGGYIEQLEISVNMESDDGSLKPGDPLVQFGNLFVQAGQITGQTFTIIDSMKQGIQDAGFVNIHEQVWKVPLGTWAADPKQRELGYWTLYGFETGLEGYALATMIRVLGWSAAEVQVFLAKLRANVRDRNVHSWHYIRVVYGQKPT